MLIEENEPYQLWQNMGVARFAKDFATKISRLWHSSKIFGNGFDQRSDLRL